MVQRVCFKPLEHPNLDSSRFKMCQYNVKGVTTGRCYSSLQFDKISNKSQCRIRRSNTTVGFAMAQFPVRYNSLWISLIALTNKIRSNLYVKCTENDTPLLFRQALVYGALIGVSMIECEKLEPSMNCQLLISLQYARYRCE